jgi:cation diffusion facilitator CzcD-associated flavoprotein CzcO
VKTGRTTNVLVIGAGPFGLSLAAQAAHDGIEHIIVGKPMEFWRKNMPAGMYLRSACDWHLDPLNVHTIERFLEVSGKTAQDVEPLSLSFYLEYAEWFREQKRIQPHEVYVQRLDHDRDFTASTFFGEKIIAQRVVLAPGFRHFAHVPDDLRALLPAGRFEHTADFVDFSNLTGARLLVIGGRQSAFEWAALLLEAGASKVYLSHRHESPAFKAAEWSWVSPLVDGMLENPRWFRHLSQSDKDAVSRRLWEEGRLKVEPWLESRLSDGRASVFPKTQLVECVEQANGEVLATLSNGETFVVDKIVLATGYKADIARLPYLAAGNVLERLETRNGFPLLDDHFETSVPGLFTTSMPAGQDFGPFFNFTIAVRVSAKLICERLGGRF